MIKARNRDLNMFFQLTKRHLIVFFRSKITVLYTLIVPIIVLIIYILFLRELEFSSVRTILQDLNISTNDNPELIKHLGAVIDSWMLSGICAVTSVTVSIQTNYIFVRDKDSGINRDFLSSPVKGPILIGSYFLSSFIITLLINFVFLLICFLYLVCNGEFMLSFVDFLTIFAIIIFSVISATLCTTFISSFMNKESSLTSVIAIFSTAIGFLIGAYMPMSMLPKLVGNICMFIPATHCCGLLRYSFLLKPFESLKTFVLDPSNGISLGSDLIEQLQGSFGFNYNFFDLTITPSYMALIVGVYAIIFVVLNIIVGNNLTKIRDTKIIKLGKKSK